MHYTFCFELTRYVQLLHIEGFEVMSNSVKGIYRKQLFLWR